MLHQSTLILIARNSDYTVIVEPWADEFLVAPSTNCRVIVINPHWPPTFTVELHKAYLIVYVNEGGSTFEFWRDEQKEYWTPVAIP